MKQASRSGWGGSQLSVVEIEVLRGLLLEPELVVLGGILEEIRGVLEYVLVAGVGVEGRARRLALSLILGIRVLIDRSGIGAGAGSLLPGRQRRKLVLVTQR